MPEIPSLTKQAGFADRMFRMDTSNPQVARLCSAGEGFFRRLVNNSRDIGTSLVLSGSVGTGKTRVARCIWNQLQAWAIEAQFASWNGVHPTSKWVDWPEMCDLDRDIAFAGQLREISESRVVFLDDVGSESDRFKSGEAASRLRRVLSECDRKWLLVTTNLSKPDFLEQYDYRVADRLSAAHWYELRNVPSYRPQLRR